MSRISRWHLRAVTDSAAVCFGKKKRKEFAFRNHLPLKTKTFPPDGSTEAILTCLNFLLPLP
jgi:hypothetical protein